jgi:uncharacterized repeat protein (TIGR01451 family)
MRPLKVALLILAVAGLISVMVAQSVAPVTAFAPQAITETFTPTATDTPVPTNTPGPVNTPLPAATPAPIILDPLITKAVSIEQAQTGDTVRFTITITNPNAIAVPNVTVVDPLPNLVDFISATTGGVGTYLFDPATHTVTFNLGTLAAGQVVVMTIRTKVNALGQPPDAFRNSATVNTGDGHSASSNTTTTILVPGQVPGAGVGPGPREVATLVFAFSALALILAAGAVWMFRRRAR